MAKAVLVAMLIMLLPPGIAMAAKEQVQFDGVVKSAEPMGGVVMDFKVRPLDEIDPKFVLTLRVEKGAFMRDGGEVSFLIHSPSRLLQTSEPVVGRSFYFVLTRVADDPKPLWHLALDPTAH